MATHGGFTTIYIYVDFLCKVHLFVHLQGRVWGFPPGPLLENHLCHLQEWPPAAFLCWLTLPTPTFRNWMVPWWLPSWNLLFAQRNIKMGFAGSHLNGTAPGGTVCELLLKRSISHSIIPSAYPITLNIGTMEKKNIQMHTYWSLMNKEHEINCQEGQRRKL